MSDNKNILGPQDQRRVNIHEDYEVRYWTKALHVSKEKLKELVAKHGDSAQELRRVLHIPDRKRKAA
ncbi:MAG TPA: DUF3606 domain-containing protein [Candidatus Angelobacter sp.]